jgi:hypothetical protein
LILQFAKNSKLINMNRALDELLGFMTDLF